MPRKAPCPITKSIPVIGLVGGIGSGKSSLAKMFCKLGAGLLDGDAAGHETLREPEVIAAVQNRWGKGVLDEKGQVSRPAVAKIVFSSPPDLEFLEKLTHPRIAKRLAVRAAALESAGGKALVLDAAVMRKAGWHKMCDWILFVDAPSEIRLGRALSRGWTESEFAAREAAQGDLQEAKGLADGIIDNRASWDDTARQVERFWRLLVGPPSSASPPVVSP
ncbi:MAG: dephospho-CoA kinase [Planctomycetia bacterium]|nr:dephospho-CoA kinase [Planctomycetia bacterium]